MIENSAVINGAGTKDDGGLDVASFSAAKLLFTEGVFAFVVLREFLSPDDLHYEKEISFNFPNVTCFVNEGLICDLFDVDLVDGVPTTKGVLEGSGE